MAALFCQNHPSREAAARCVSCGGSFCRECVTPYEGRMLCGGCLKEKQGVVHEVNPRSFWWPALVQMGLGIGLLWGLAWLLGRVLADMPEQFHEGTMWDKIGF